MCLGASSTLLGVAHGSDLHCRRVCGAVPACNGFFRKHGASSECVLDARCRSSSSPPPNAACGLGAFTAVASKCRLPVVWKHLAYRSRSEGEHLTIVMERSPRACRDACVLTRGCRGFAMLQHGGGRTECHLKSGCATKADLDAAHGAPVRLTPSQRKSMWRSNFMWPCGDERPGVRRALQRGRAGLFHIDCPLQPAPPTGPAAADAGANVTSPACARERAHGSEAAWRRAHVGRRARAASSSCEPSGRPAPSCA